MTDTPMRFFFDFVDPLSYLVERAITAVERSEAVEVVRVGFELRPPPSELTMLSEPFWTNRLSVARRAAEEEVSLAPPELVPWSRKAHELHVFAAETGRSREARAAVFEAYFGQGRDIGRIDELVAIAASVGLDPTETKAVLDVDRLESLVAERRADAAALGISDVPTVVVGGTVIQGFPNLSELSTLLGGR